MAKQQYFWPVIGHHFEREGERERDWPIRAEGDDNAIAFFDATDH